MTRTYLIISRHLIIRPELIFLTIEETNIQAREEKPEVYNCGY